MEEVKDKVINLEKYNSRQATSREVYPLFQKSFAKQRSKMSKKKSFLPKLDDSTLNFVHHTEKIILNPWSFNQS